MLVGIDPDRIAHRRPRALLAGSGHVEGAPWLEGDQVTAEPLEQQLRAEAGHVGPIAAPDVQRVDRHECPDGLANCVPRRAEQVGEVPLGR